jgi:hypothetical protein
MFQTDGHLRVTSLTPPDTPPDYLQNEEVYYFRSNPRSQGAVVLLSVDESSYTSAYRRSRWPNLIAVLAKLINRLQTTAPQQAATRRKGSHIPLVSQAVEDSS